MIRAVPRQPAFRPYLPNLDLLETMDDITYFHPDLPEGGVIIKAGTVTDGASVPYGFRWLVGQPFLPRYQLATLLHDVMYRYRIGTQRLADDLFLDLLAINGVGRIRRRLMWGVLRLVGWIYWHT